MVLIGNIVTKIEHYRLYCIAKIPSLRVLDFQKVTLKERIAAKEMFGDGKDQIVQIAKEKKQLTKEEKQRREKAIKLRMRIEQAETLEEIAQIEEEMKKGNFDEVLAEMDEEDAKSE
mmetsp:Transcript_33104/g.38033  ORF Transcript_33104/g.38033 Transcript_33104/m.38033 type:complete len:117 (-) Transcript_33104:27-377(-)